VGSDGQPKLYWLLISPHHSAAPHLDFHRLELGEHYGRAAAAATDAKARVQLQTLTESYRVLAKRAAVLNRSNKAHKNLEKRRRVGDDLLQVLSRSRMSKRDGRSQNEYSQQCPQCFH
jgi:hypothetical protein